MLRRWGVFQDYLVYQLSWKCKFLTKNFRKALHWPNYIMNSVDKTKSSCSTNSTQFQNELAIVPPTTTNHYLLWVSFMRCGGTFGCYSSTTQVYCWSHFSSKNCSHRKVVDKKCLVNTGHQLHIKIINKEKILFVSFSEAATTVEIDIKY